MKSPIWLLYIGGKKRLTVTPHNLDYFQTHFVGKPMKKNWQTPPVEIRGKSLRLKDFVGWMTKAPVCSERAKHCLEPIIGEYAEFLPLIKIRGKMHYAINVVKMVDCLDLERSEISYFEHDPTRIMDIHTYKFLPERMEDLPIFKVPQQRGAVVFVTKKFVDIVVANKLVGASFADPSINCWEYVLGKREANTVPNVIT
jgi:hypothetical protein